MNKTLKKQSRLGRQVCAAAATVLLSCSAALAQILVPAGGVGPIAFDARPAVADGWATRSVGTSGGTFTTADALDTSVIASADATTVTTQVGSSTTLPPSENAVARWNGAGFWLQTRPTTVDYLILMATLRNDSSSDQSSVTIEYDWDQKNNIPVGEQIPGHRVYYSLTGAPGSWVLIPELSTFTTSSTAQHLAATVAVGNWAANSLLYIIWVDDNGSGGGTDPMEGAYTIDNFIASFGTLNVPLGVTLNTPPTGTTYLTSSATSPANQVLSASSVGTVPATSVSFYVDGAFFATDTAAPYSNYVSNLPIGTHTVYAVAMNGTETAYSRTNTIIVRDEFVHFTGGNIFQDFDEMGATGTVTPVGWYAGTTSPFNSVTVVATNGDHRPIGAAQALNMGTIDSGERALATQATGGDRSMVVRIKNDTSSSITSVDLYYDGELWRPYTNAQYSLITLYSVDGGGTWITNDVALNFTQPTPIADPPGSVAPTALDGNLDENRVPEIGGTITLESPVPPGGVLYLRWYDVNEGGDDGVLGIDNVSITPNVSVFAPTITISSPDTGANFAFMTTFQVVALPSFANPVTNVTFYADNLSNVLGVDTNSPFSIGVSNLSVGAHTLWVIGQDSTGVRATNTAMVTVNIAPNMPPSVTVTNPIVGSREFFVGSMVTNVSAEATDSDGTIARVEFYLDNVLRATDTSSAYGFDLGSIPAGTHTLTAVAVDNAGGRGSNSITLVATNPPDITVVVENNAEWKYLDNGTDPGATWNQLAFNDTGWSNGFAELGYGDGPGRPERTVITQSNNSSALRFATTYFRKKFTVADPASISSLTVRIMMDDHAVVYLNGTQIFSDMTNTVITYQTYEAPDISGDGTVWHEATVPASLLVAGENIIAAEVHQTSGTSSDVSFDLMLWATGGGATGPRLTITRISDTQVRISWGADATGLNLQSNTDLGNAAGWTTVQAIAGAGETTITTTGTMRYFRLRSP